MRTRCCAERSPGCATRRHSLRRFVDRWFGARDVDAAPLGERVLNHVMRHDLDGWAHTPLMATMLCALAEATPAAPLPNTRAAVYGAFADQLMTRLSQETEPVVAALQDRMIELLEQVAFQRQPYGIGTRFLDQVLEWAAVNLPTPPKRLQSRWPEIVRGTICLTGLVVASADDLAFSHTSVEEYFAARVIARNTPQQICELFGGCLGLYDGARGFFFSIIGLVGFVLDLTNADDLVVQIIKSFPSAAAIVEDLYDRPLGIRTAAALREIVDDQYFLDNRVAAASVLNLVSPGEGVPHLLELSINLDVEESDRLTIIQSLTQSSPTDAAAIQWLIFETCDYTLDYGYRVEAIPLVTGLPLTTDDRVAGLRLIATTPQLPDEHRVAACADLTEYDRDAAYALLRTLMPIKSVMMHLSSDRQGGYEFGILRRLALDPGLSTADRFDAADHIELCYPDEARAVYRELSQCPSFNAAQRAKAAAAAQALGTPNRMILE